MGNRTQQSTGTAILTMVLALVLGSERCTWAEAPYEGTAAIAPPARIYPTMVAPPGSDYVYVFAGAWASGSGSSDLQDAWKYHVKTNVWSEAEGDLGSVQPVQVAAYDTESARLIVLSVLDARTWAYDFSSGVWEEMQPDPAPSMECYQRIAYDAESDRIILFGGARSCGSTSCANETWSYDYNADTWIQMQPDPKPAGRCNHTMVYDAESDRVIVWGGRPSWRAAENTVWAYDYNSNTWTELESPTGPERRYTHQSAVYHAASDRILMFGGVALTGTFSGDLIAETWSYDYNSNTWTQLRPATHPEARSRHEMVYHPGMDKVVLFGGETDSAFFGQVSDETWVLDPVTAEWTRATDEWIPSWSPVERADVEPATAWTGSPAELAARVTLRTDPDASERLSLDLSPLGLPESVPLSHLQDSEYAGSQTVNLPRNGVFYLPIRLGTETLCHVPLQVWPGSDLVVIDDGLNEGWLAEPSTSLSLEYGEHAGLPCLCAHSTGRCRLDLVPQSPVDTLGYAALSFAIHPGSTSVPAAPRFSVHVNRNSVARADLLDGEADTEAGIDMAAAEWQRVTLALDALGVGTEVQRLCFRADLTGTFYLGDLRLVASHAPPATAVSTAEATLSPGFALDQNCPNPFNGDTVIRFSLQEPADAELAVLNLMGQRVVTLLSGNLPAGAHSIRWDGRDDGGVDVASGVYLCRLRVGDGTAGVTRKLAVLR